MFSFNETQSEQSMHDNQASSSVRLQFPSLRTGDHVLDMAFRIAIGDLTSNIVPYIDGLLEHEESALMAGLDYNTPWTRDSAINTWNGAGLLCSDVARSTLLSVLKDEQGKVMIGGQYWDAIIWTIGAWSYYLYTGDHELLKLAFMAVKNSLAFFEESEFTPDLNLFRGAACYGDGVAAYPDIYAQTNGSSSILAWPRVNPDLASKPGVGLPMHALSTNCLYYQAYKLLELMAYELHEPIDPHWGEKALALKTAINQHFWNAETGTYRYLIDPFGNCDHQEALGHAFALLFGVANEEQVQSILKQQYVTAHGVPCVWPPFERYSSEDGYHFGRHCGVVWPHIQGFWSQAVLEHRRMDLFTHELYNLATKADRDSQFAEIDHPGTGEVYGGRQEGCPEKSGIWKSCTRQTWSATAYLRMILLGVFGLNFDYNGITLQPHVPDQLTEIKLYNIPYRSMVLDIEIHGSGSRVLDCTINGKVADPPHIPADGEGYQKIIIRMTEEM